MKEAISRYFQGPRGFSVLVSMLVVYPSVYIISKMTGLSDASATASGIFGCVLVMWCFIPWRYMSEKQMQDTATAHDIEQLTRMMADMTARLDDHEERIEQRSRET